MALTDLANLDLLDVTLAKYLPSDEVEDMLNTFNEAFAMVLANALENEFKPEDHQSMQDLLRSKDVTAEKIEQFYIDRIPHFQAKIVLLALEFKKKFLLNVYQNKIEEYKNVDNKYGLAAWEQVYQDALADNWNEVGRYLKVIESMVPPTPPADQTSIPQKTG